VFSRIMVGALGFCGRTHALREDGARLPRFLTADLSLSASLREREAARCAATPLKSARV
jgi:hypothetical protein